MSQISHTTVGGGTLEEVVRGKKTYVAQKECLIDLRNEEDIDVVKQKLLCHCEEICTHLEENSLRTINKFYIGKALITQRRKPRGKGFIKFDPMDPNTWKKNGISSRWGTHKKEDYGRDGMIVLTAITKEAVLHRHQGNKKSLPHQEQYGLALEQMLQHHYKLKKNDPRFANNTFTSGGSDKGKSIAYAVYIAFSLSDHDEETTMEGVSNPQQLASDEDSSISAMNDPSQTSTQEPNVMSTSESLFSPTYVSRNKRPRTEPHPPGTKRRHQESGQDANMRTSTIGQCSTNQDELLTDQQQKMIRVVELLREEVRAMKETSNGIEQNPDQLQSEESQHFILVCQDGSSNSTQSIQEVSYKDQTAHTDRPQGSQTTHASTSTSSAGSKRTKKKKKVSFR